MKPTVLSHPSASLAAVVQRAAQPTHQSEDEGASPVQRLHLLVTTIEPKLAKNTVVAHHYLHRKPPISFAYGLYDGSELVGVVTYGVPPSRHLQMSACPSNPNLVIELNRLWVHDRMPRNTGSWFVARTLRMMPPLIVVSYADSAWGHYGYVYRAMNFNYAGWTDMERKTPRYDYLPANPKTHTRDAFRNGYVAKVRRRPKVKYWITTGSRVDKRRLNGLCGWPSHDWNTMPPPFVEPVKTKDSDVADDEATA